MKKSYYVKAVACSLGAAMLLTACGSTAGNGATATSTGSTETATIPEETAAATSEATETVDNAPVDDGYSGGNVIVYFSNWNLGEKKGAEGGEVASIPWEDVTYINHAFWEVYPADGTNATTFEWRDAGNEPRTQFAIVPTDEYPDLEDEEESEVVPGLQRNHFSEYAYFSELYPDVNIMISVGGWTDCGYFSEMAYTEEGRQSFADSCVELIKQYPWIDGIDIDWEYPGCDPDGERYPEGGSDEGCPMWGTVEEDNDNCAALFKCLKETMAAEFGEGAKKLTACAASSTGWTLKNQDWSKLAVDLDMVNIMTYDMAGLWDGVTGYGSNATSSKAAAQYFCIMQGVPYDKINIGSPMYGTVFLMKAMDYSKIVGAPIENYTPNVREMTAEDIIKGFEAEAVSGFKKEFVNGRWVKGEEFDNGGKGWHTKYNKSQGAAYMYNDDESSRYYKWFISYENEVTLQDKLDVIKELNLSGIIVWECAEDCIDHTMIKEMGDQIIR